MFGTFEADLVLFEEKIVALEKRILTPLDSTFIASSILKTQYCMHWMTKEERDIAVLAKIESGIHT